VGQQEEETMPAPEGVEHSPAGPGRDRFTESSLFPYLLYAAAFAGVGVAVGFAVIHNIGIRREESAVLLDSGGSAIGLLAVTLAAVALLLAFLTGPYKRIIEAVGARKFFWPFVPVAVLSAAAAIMGLTGALDSQTGPLDARATLDGIALGLFAASVMGVVYLVWVFLFHAGVRQSAEAASAAIHAPNQSSDADGSGQAPDSSDGDAGSGRHSGG
jgi:hypothetical protein